MAPAKREEAEEAGEILIMGHVTSGVDKYQQTYETDHHQHHRRERIEYPAKINCGRAEAYPRKVHRFTNCVACEPAREHVRERCDRDQ